ncbi:MAG TPA: HNH endonuclease, partial [Actinomycetota bacterium]|nr:HNH endonuclease [Actinomycetota bacterium]
KDRPEAYLADALVSRAEEGSSPNTKGHAGPRAMVHVRVDHAALLRGHRKGAETCEIAGIGPIPVATARALASDAVLAAVLTEGADVKAVAHLGRTIPARLRTALQTRDTECAVPGCHNRHRLEIDHIEPFAEGGPTSLDNLVRLCRPHHHMKTNLGFRLVGGPGKWKWISPDETAATAKRSPP